MVNIRAAVVDEAPKDRIMDIIVDLHLHWLNSVKDIEKSQELKENIKAEYVINTFIFTIDAMEHRYKCFERYVTHMYHAISFEEQNLMQADLEIIEEMNRHVTHFLLRKQKCFLNYMDDIEYQLKLNELFEELLNWLDNVIDKLVLELTELINVYTPHFSDELTKNLKQIFDEVHHSDNPSNQKFISDLKKKGTEIDTMLHSNPIHNLEMSKVKEKIRILIDRIKRLESENSSAITGLLNKKSLLEKRLFSLQNLTTEGLDEHNTFGNRIFNHLLPVQYRERLVSRLCYLWDIAIFKERSRKSIISILSANEVKEEFTDELGTFILDEHSRKLYKKKNDDTLYQINENNELVPLTDDLHHIYFYDECGRYYMDPTLSKRIYKAHATASEYVINSSGMLVKVREEQDGIVYCYDNYGRYYINEDGKRIYREAGSASEYEYDGFGNLVRLQSQATIFQPCPDYTHASEECEYLKRTVGTALRECVADCVLYQPVDPVKYLAARLVKFRENVEMKEKLEREKKELNIARDLKAAQERATAKPPPASLSDIGAEDDSSDINLHNYKSATSDASVPIK
ncbi:hypothetical protein EVAR_43055_1 [Eumeta japonica]|uniref:Uncharacterized protein n=1 Tax=Eumeta variegata TaxID=151549 RepID=A0A4C1WVE4_EUMVA|nr:hypothetical protein EVAR_43055_1 [Eumeta japonica]